VPSDRAFQPRRYAASLARKPETGEDDEQGRDNRADPDHWFWQRSSEGYGCAVAVVRRRRVTIAVLAMTKAEDHSRPSKSLASPTAFMQSASLPASSKVLARFNTASTLPEAMFSATAIDSGVGW
jgi:hypothetical protein